MCAGKMFVTDNGYRQPKNTKFFYIGYRTVTKIKFPSSITIIRNRSFLKTLIVRKDSYKQPKLFN